MKGPRLRIEEGTIQFSCHGCEYLGGYVYDAVRPCLKIGVGILDYETPENCPYAEKLIKNLENLMIIEE